MSQLKSKFILIGVLSVLLITGLIVLWFVRPREQVVVVQPTVETQPVTPVEEPTPAPEPEPEPAADIDSDDSLLKIVNKWRKVSSSYVPQLVDVTVASDDKQQIRPEVNEKLEAMFAAASESGIQLNVVSGYRSYKYQQSLWYTYEQKYGKKYAAKMDAIPGASEHQLGLAVDLSGNVGCKLKQCFANTSAGKWLAEHASEYGFIMRYPNGKENVTGVMYSPWHYRYVGVDVATAICESKMTMEEYYGLHS